MAVQDARTFDAPSEWLKYPRALRLHFQGRRSSYLHSLLPRKRSVWEGSLLQSKGTLKGKMAELGAAIYTCSFAMHRRNGCGLSCMARACNCLWGPLRWKSEGDYYALGNAWGEDLEETVKKAQSLA